MKRTILFRLFLTVGVVCCVMVFLATPGVCQDIRGLWSGNAKGAIFGAEGSVNITDQRGEEILGVVEGGNIFGKAKFTINGKVRNHQIFGSKDGHTFQGFLYPDGCIRGIFRASDGDTYQVFLQRAYSHGWGLPPGIWPQY
jgi:hypothetical protein